MPLEDDLLRAEQDMQDLMQRELPMFAATELQNIIADSFRAERWMGDPSSTPWPKRKKADKRLSRALLVLSGNMKRSATDVQVVNNRVVTDVPEPYAQIHNEGGTITLPARSETFRRPRQATGKKKGRYIRITRATPAQPGPGHTIGEHEVTIPQRQFMPIPNQPVPVLNKALDDHLTQRLPQILGQ